MRGSLPFDSVRDPGLALGKERRCRNQERHGVGAASPGSWFSLSLSSILRSTARKRKEGERARCPNQAHFVIVESTTVIFTPSRTKDGENPSEGVHAICAPFLRAQSESEEERKGGSGLKDVPAIGRGVPPGRNHGQIAIWPTMMTTTFPSPCPLPPAPCPPLLQLQTSAAIPMAFRVGSLSLYYAVRYSSSFDYFPHSSSSWSFTYSRGPRLSPPFSQGATVLSL